MISGCVVVYVILNMLSFCDGNLRNLAFNKPATQISQYLLYSPDRAVDGIDGLNYKLGSCSHTKGYSGVPYDLRPWWQVDLLTDYYIKAVAISHIELGVAQLTHNFSIEIYKNGQFIDDADRCYYHDGFATLGTTEVYLCKTTIVGRYVRIVINGVKAEMLVLCEVRVIGTEHKTTSSSITRTDDIEPDQQGYGQCAMRCYVLPKCRIFSVKSMSDYYQCNIFTTKYPKLVANSTAGLNTAVFMI